jgi:nucleotide-binding universal stress UspA family protein
MHAHQRDASWLAALVRPTEPNSTDTPTRRAKRRGAYTGDAIVRHEFGLDDLVGLDELTIERYGPPASQRIESILVPVAGGPNSDAAVALASNVAAGWDASVTLLTVVPTDATDERTETAETTLRDYADEAAVDTVETAVVASDDVVSTIAGESDAHDLLVVGASERSLFARVFRGSIPERLGETTRAPMFVVSR